MISNNQISVDINALKSTFAEVSDLDDYQPLITSSAKISADLIDDSSSTNKFVTATDKTTWNAKQDAIDSSHKLDADLVDDSTSTNKFVTATDKTTWNGKQDAIADLSDIRSGAALGATALQQSDVVSTYSASSTAPLNGIAVDLALGTYLTYEVLTD